MYIHISYTYDCVYDYFFDYAYGIIYICTSIIHLKKYPEDLWCIYIYIAWVAGFLQNQPPPAPLHGSVGDKNSLIMLAT